MSFVHDLRAFIDQYVSLRAQWGRALDIFVVVLITGVLDLLTRGLFTWLHRRVRHSRNLWDDAIYYGFNGPLQGVLWLIGISVSIHIGSPEDASWRAYVPTVRAIALTLVVAWFFFRLIRSIETNALAQAARSDNRLDATTADALAKLLRGTVLVTAGLMLLNEFGVSLSGLLAFSGIGGIAIGFAARDVLANIFGGVTIYLNRPFSVGDWIRSPDRDIEGVVEAIGWRATTLRRFDMRPLYVPNAVFSNVALENPSRMTHRRITETVGLRYEDAAVVPDIVEAVRSMLDADDAIDSDQAILTYLDSLGASALNLLIYCYTRTTDWAEYLAVKQSVLQRVQDIVRDHDAAIAFPTTTMHIPGELRLAEARPAAGDSREEIDTRKVESERDMAVSRERQAHKGRVGPDNPIEEGDS